MKKIQHQAVRDLAWCCQSPPLLNSLPESDIGIWPTASTNQHANWLQELDQNPDELLNAIAKIKSTRLGIYYETLWHFYWQQQTSWEVIGHNLPVYKDGQTLGAFDFILRHANEYWHCETAIKFYLGVGSTTDGPSEWHEWIGPNCNDRLDLKLHHLLQHQLPLSKNLAGMEKLDLFFGPGINYRQALCLQGYLFYPAHQEMNAPVAAHALHHRGSWWYLKDFLSDLRDGKFDVNYWFLLPRHRWLAPAQTMDINELLAGENLRDSLRYWVGNMSRPQLLAAMVKEDGLWVEKTRGFVMPDHWPWIT